MKFYKCEKCGKIAVLFRESQCPTKCCGEAMVEIVPGTVDAAREKHIPDIQRWLCGASHAGRPLY